MSGIGPLRVEGGQGRVYRDCPSKIGEYEFLGDLIENAVWVDKCFNDFHEPNESCFPTVCRSVCRSVHRRHSCVFERSGKSRHTPSVRPEKFQFMEKGQNRNFDYKIVISVKNLKFIL